MDAFKNTKFLKISQSHFNSHWVDYDEITYSNTFKDLKIGNYIWQRFRLKNDITGRVRYWVRNHEATKGVWLDDFKNGEPVIIYVPIPDEDMPEPVPANEVEPVAQEEVLQEEQKDAEDAEEEEEDNIDWKKSFNNLSSWVASFIRENTDLLLQLQEFQKNQSKVTKTSP